jgi:hypothetical protein
MAQITIGSKFFRNEARSYGDPAMGLWRELIQNAIDNGATKIDIKTEKVGDSQEVVKVTFADNGTGMDRNTLEKVYFCLGETTKGGEGDIGGFGRARLLTCFAQEAYTIRTQNLQVIGSGSEYEIEETEEFYAGCSFEIDVHLHTMKAKPYYSYEQTDERLLGKLRGYLSKCQFPTSIEVTINGERFNDFLLKRAKRGSLSFATIHVVKKPSANGGYVFVRVRGALMFEKNLYGSNALVVVEIDPEKSREVLVSNRDSLVHKYEEELDALIQTLTVNAASGLDEDRSETVVSAGGYRKVTRRDLSLGKKKEKIEEPTVPATDETGEVADEIIGAINAAGRAEDRHAEVPRASMNGGGSTLVIERAKNQVAPPTAASIPVGAPSTAHYSFVPSGPVAYEVTEVYDRVPASETEYTREIVEVDVPEIDPLTQGMHFVLQTTAPKVRTAARKWQARYLAAKGPGRNRRKLLAQWVVACEWAISALLEIEGSEDSNLVEAWSPGVIFSDSTRAAYQAGEDTHSHVFLLNPLDDEGRLRFTLDDLGDHAEMVASAAHEVCHAVYDWHSESYAGLLTRMMGKLMPHMASIHREMMKAA